ncbi:hypothetical protein F7725_010190 [Dissostichus mawsoni]|uniref:Uncharacterized protein n=1 Tax=Dissostichus mawsoni TaxID=36200 RepID=A0A7J5XMW2_DISMA|nr:hypothetical protein F7725_010190 [Dissostichus mawsoni]
MLDVVPTIQTTGSYHRQDLCLFTVGKILTGLGGEGRVVSGQKPDRQMDGKKFLQHFESVRGKYSCKVSRDS